MLQESGTCTKPIYKENIKIIDLTNFKFLKNKNYKGFLKVDLYIF